MFREIDELGIESNSSSVPPLINDVDDYISNSSTSSPWNTSPDDSAASEEQDSIISHSTQQRRKQASYGSISTVTDQSTDQSSASTQGEKHLVQFPVDHLQELLKGQEEKRKKLKRKAELARLSRRKKKQRMGDLEAQVEGLENIIRQLKAENASLRDSVKQRELDVLIKQEKITTVGELLKEIPKKPSLASDYVSKLIQGYGSQTEKSKATLDLLKEMLEPSVPLQFLDWVLNQKDAFYADEEGLFLSLFREELKVTQLQLKKILGMRPTVEKEDPSSALATEKDTLTQLLKRLEQHSVWDQDKRFERFCSILKPSQVISYVEWVQKFGQVCIKIKV